MMDTYDRLLRLRSILEFEDNDKPIPKHELFDTMENLKKEYLDVVTEVLTGYLNLHAKKEKASLMLSVLDKLGNKDIKYVGMLSEVVEQFDRDDRNHLLVGSTWRGRPVNECCQGSAC
jgi:hypothetical protein